jgi:hypothetical protein
MIIDAATLAGRLLLVPGTAAPIGGGRPVVSAAVMQRLTEGIAAEALPARLGLLFSLCGPAHRITARRAVAAAMADAGTDQPTNAAARATWQAEDRLLALWTAREHLQRIALDLPLRLPVAGVPADAGWLRGQPLAVLPADVEAVGAHLLPDLQRALLPWLEYEVLGGPAAEWQAAFAAGLNDDGATGPLQQWSARRHPPAQRWLHGAAAAGRALTLPCRALPAAVVEAGGLTLLAATLEADPGFAARPIWDGQPAETGCWTRVSHPGTGAGPHNAWMRWMYRIAELIALAEAGSPLRLASGMLSLGNGRGIAWSEMSRGLLVYLVRLARRSGAWAVDSCRLIAPTEWNFHPAGGLAGALQATGLATDTVRAAVAAMDPCVEFRLPAAGAGVAHA